MSMPNTDRTEERWAYGGLRVLDGKRVHAWLSDSGDGRELLYAMKGTYSVGEIYRATVERREGHVILIGTPDYHADGRLDPDHTAELRARHHAAQTRLSLIKLERAAARRNELDDAIAPLRDLVRRTPNHADRSALVAYITRALLT